jgi:hypothetical protein
MQDVLIAIICLILIGLFWKVLLRVVTAAAVIVVVLVGVRYAAEGVIYVVSPDYRKLLADHEQQVAKAKCEEAWCNCPAPELDPVPANEFDPFREAGFVYVRAGHWMNGDFARKADDPVCKSSSVKPQSHATAEPSLRQ